MDRICNEERLRLGCEHGFGIQLAKFVDIGVGAGSRNYLAESPDGNAFIIKVMKNVLDASILARRFAMTELINGVRCLFDGMVLNVDGMGIIALSYCAGDEIHFENYDARKITNLISVYSRFSDAIQSADELFQAFDLVGLRALIADHATKQRSHMIRNLLDEMPIDDAAYREGELRIIHGDFHYANFRFHDDEIAGIFDLRDFRPGYPTDDFVRLVLCSAERMKWYNWFSYARLFDNFRMLVRHAKYSEHEWLVAINGYFIRKIAKRYRKHDRLTMFQKLNLLFRGRFYRTFRRIVVDECRCKQ